jgi:hypothetical protein
MPNTIKQIGVIGVDAGLCWIGDPSYIMHHDRDSEATHASDQEAWASLSKAIGNSWSEFCDILNRGQQHPTARQFNYVLGHPGLGVCVETGYGDGIYPVYAEINDEGRIAKVSVEFITDDDDAQEGA